MKKKSKSAKGVSLATVRKLWYEYNRLVFGNNLYEPIIRITRARNYYGKFVCRESDGGKTLVLLISGPLHVGSGGLNDTVLHEMIHQWQWENGYKENEHDETFTQWLPKIQEKTGITLQDTWSVSEGGVG